MPRPDASAKLAETKPKNSAALQVWIAVGLVVALIVGGFAAVLLTNSGGTNDAAGPANSITDGNGVQVYPGKATAGAPQVDFYLDYQCPGCHALDTNNGAQMMQMAKDGEIKLTLHVMSFLDERLGNKSSTQAANAAFCADDAGKLPEFHLELFKNQPEQEGAGYPTSIYHTVAQKVGITGSALATFDTCVKDNKYKDYVAATEERSGKNDIAGTPAVIVDGTKVTDIEEAFNALTKTPNSFKSIVTKYAKKS